MSGNTFEGALGQTSTETTTVWCGGCGAWFGAQIYRSLDADEEKELVERFRAVGFEAINSLVCGSCGWTHVARERVAIHYPSRRKIFLLILENLRHRAQRIRANFIEDVSRAPGGMVPPYVLEPVLVGGHAELCRILKERETGLNDMAIPSEPPPELEPSESGTSADEDSPDDKPTARRRTRSLNLLAELLDDDDEAVSDDPVSAQYESGTGALPGIDVDLDVAENAGGSSVSEPAPVGRLTRETTGAALRILLDDSVTHTPEPKADPPTKEDFVEANSMTPEDLSEAAPLDGLTDEPASDEGAVTGELDSVDADSADAASVEPASVDADSMKTELEDSLVEVDAASSVVEPTESPEALAVEVEAPTLPGIDVVDDRVHIRMKDPDPADAAMRTVLEPVFQMHLTDAGPALCLLLKGPHGDEGHEVFGFDPGNVVHERALRLLSDEFAFELQFMRDDTVVGERRVEAPLAENVAAALASSGEERSAGATELLEVPGYPLIGGVQHNFTEDQFSGLLTAAETQLALSIVSYWSEPEQSQHLLHRLSFPLTWWRAIQRRCAEAGLQFGLFPEPSMREAMMRVGQYESEETLLRALISHYVEVNLKLRANELDPLGLWQNWDQLLAWGETMGVTIDAQVEEIAALALEAAEAYSDDDGEISDESYEAIEVSLADAIDIKSLGAFNLRIDGFLNSEQPETSLIQPAMGELSDEELVAALKDPDRRAGASVQLLARDPADCAASIFDAILLMSPMELVVVVPSILPVADVFVPLFRRALSADALPQRMSASMLLAEVRDERAFNPMLGMMLDADEEQWELLAASVAQLGPSVIQPALSRARVDQAGLARIAVLLGYAASYEPGCLDGLDRYSDDPAVIACIGQARAVAEKLGRLEIPPFAHRLAALFESVQHGSVSLNISEL
jgi:hypothetical protein